MTETSPPTRLARRLGLGDAIVVGLGSMIGAGVFSAVAPAAGVAGNALVPALGIAAFVAYCNAIASAQLAARYPESGGTYVYGRKQLSPLWGFVAGWGFVVGKMASVAAMGLTFGHYAVPAAPRPAAALAVLALTAVNYFGVKKTVAVTRWILTAVLVVLAIVVAAVLAGAPLHPEHLVPLDTRDPRRLLEAAGMLFFAFAGYARIATLGEEVEDPARTIPRAIPAALAVTLLVYGAVAITTLLAIDAQTLGLSSAPLADAVRAGRFGRAAVLVRLGAALASLGVMLSLIAGISRTLFAMASNGDMPRTFAAVHPRHQVPHRAELAVGLVAALVAASLDLRSAIGFSSFAVLVYYAIANAAAFTLPPEHRTRPRFLSVLGIVGCTAVALSLPAEAVIGGASMLAVGAAVYLARSRRTGNRNRTGSREDEKEG